ncbi:MAG: 2-hydroxy-6-oxo-2,4-heptadienoate hydrolase [Hirschia sp.]|nr:2-hydroxy-6-oxo-2,4-heptadienoate hydrolase [Hirschia sp.]MBF16962.1 2-hydroxy-6-oxo-2,4-heptadienoate hydrolase [Hirschia sp.]
MSETDTDIKQTNPEVAKVVNLNGIRTNYHDLGAGFPVMLIHGSGPGVSAWANWRLAMPGLSKVARVIAPDMLGFGYSDRPGKEYYNKDQWLNQLLSLMDALEIERTDLVGNSFGGGISLAMAIRYPDRVRRIVLMGSAGLDLGLSDALDQVWGYTPSLDNMRRLLDIFAYDRALVTDELAELRYQASIRPGFQESFSEMFPAPRGRWLTELASEEGLLREIPHETLVIHGREDLVVPLENGYRLAELIQRSQLHVFGQCGHWAQIEHAARFEKLVIDFIMEKGNS